MSYAAPVVAELVSGEVLRVPLQNALSTSLADANLRVDALDLARRSGALAEARFQFSNASAPFAGQAADDRFGSDANNRLLAAISGGQPSDGNGGGVLQFVFNVYAFERAITTHTDFVAVNAFAERSVEVALDVEVGADCCCCLSMCCSSADRRATQQVDLSFVSPLVRNDDYRTPRLVMFVEFAFGPSDVALTTLSASRLPPMADLARLARAGDAVWQEKVGDGELDVRFATLAAFGAPTKTTLRRAVVRAVPVPRNATHFRIVSERVLHRTFDAAQMPTTVVWRNEPRSTFAPTSTIAKFITVTCPPVNNGEQPYNSATIVRSLDTGFTLLEVRSFVYVCVLCPCLCLFVIVGFAGGLLRRPRSRL